MIYKSAFLSNYVAQAPLALAFERSLECTLYPGLTFDRPILDLGCGEGLFAHILFAEKIDTGIDPNATELKRASELGAYDELIQCAGDSIPKPDSFYGTVISNSVIEHIPDLDPILHEVRRVLKPGGYFYITAPSQHFERHTLINTLLEIAGMNKIACGFRAYFNKFWAHYNVHSLEDWGKLFEKAGFEIIDAFSYNSKKSCLLNDALVPISIPSLILKKLTNQWVLLPGIRRLIVSPVAAILRRCPTRDQKLSDGGLVFFAMRKPTA